MRKLSEDAACEFKRHEHHPIVTIDPELPDTVFPPEKRKLPPWQVTGVHWR